MLDFTFNKFKNLQRFQASLQSGFHYEVTLNEYHLEH